jgi:hypothetical protein
MLICKSRSDYTGKVQNAKPHPRANHHPEDGPRIDLNVDLGIGALYALCFFWRARS